MSLLATSCNRDNDQVPQLPPVESFLMDFSDFTTFPDTADNKKSVPAYGNFTYSFVTVSVWNLLTTAALTVPAAVYLESFNHTPESMGDDVWEWTYSVEPYTARLVTTRISNEQFTAEMYISKMGEGAFEDFKWFEGTVRYDHTHANWKLYESPANNVQWLDIQWAKDWEAGASEITYMNVKAGSQELGSYITYGIHEDPMYDAYYTVVTASNEVYIQYNTKSKAGRVKSPDHFKDSDWHCWNEQFQDTDCGEIGP